MKVTVTVSPAPGNRNNSKGQHWSKYQKERRRISWDVWAQLQAAGRPKLNPPVRVLLERRAWNRMDPTGVIESAKPVIDALVEHGVIPDDDARNIAGISQRQEICREKPVVSELRVTLIAEDGGAV